MIPSSPYNPTSPPIFSSPAAHPYEQEPNGRSPSSHTSQSQPLLPPPMFPKEDSTPNNPGNANKFDPQQTNQPILKRNQRLP
jgi:hypothetical protein